MHLFVHVVYCLFVCIYVCVYCFFLYAMWGHGLFLLRVLFVCISGYRFVGCVLMLSIIFIWEDRNQCAGYFGLFVF